MRRLGFRLGLAACAVLLLGAALAPQPARTRSAAASGLRGAQAAKPAKPVPIASPRPRPGLPASVASAVPADPGQCRLVCAHTYYFCLSGDDAPSCPQSWTSCLTDCSRPGIQPDAKP